MKMDGLLTPHHLAIQLQLSQLRMHVCLKLNALIVNMLLCIHLFQLINCQGTVLRRWMHSLQLFHELEDLYIDGQEVFFHSKVCGQSPEDDTACLRAIPLLATADSKAHAEIGF